MDTNAKTIFYQFLDEEPNDPSAFLERTCGTDLSLRREVEALLACHERPEALLDEPLFHQSSDRSTVEHDPPTAVRSVLSSQRSTAPFDVPGYDILDELGRGGKGVVYLARQIQADRLVAIKFILNREYASLDDRRRFQTEAEAIGRLQHPGIVQIFEVGERDGNPFFSFEYCSAGNLDRYLDGTPLSPREAAEVTVSLAQSVEVAHRAKILHRDLKPANVLLVPRSEPSVVPQTGQHAAENRPPINSFHVKLTDFGLSKKLDQDTQTQTGLIAGTPSYMAPEQTRTDAEIGFAVDVYALGAILYECLTGRPPFNASNHLDILLQVANDSPVSPRGLISGIPLDLETICLKCLHKDPTRRYRSAESLAADLQRYLDGKPIHARPVGVAERTWRWTRRNPVVAGLTILLALVLVVGIFTTSWGWLRANDHLERANDQKRVAVQERTRAERAERGALNNKAKAERQRDRAERAFYYQSLSVAQTAWQNHQPRHAREVLARCKPELRGWEYEYLHHVFHTRGRRTLRGHPNAVGQLLFAPAGNRLLCAGQAEVVVWNIETSTIERTIPMKSLGETSYFLSPDGTRLARGVYNKIDGIWDVETGAKLSTDTTKTPSLVWLDYDLKQNKVVSTLLPRQTDTVRTFPLGEKPLVGRKITVNPVDPKIAVSPDETQLFSVAGNAVRLWDAVTLTELPAPSVDRVTRRSPCFCGGTDRIAWIRLETGIIRIFDTETGNELGTIKDPADEFRGMAFSPDGRLVATYTNSDEGSVRLWDVATRKMLRTYYGHTGKIQSLAFHPKGRYFATASEDHTVTLWDIQRTNEPLFVDWPRAESLCFRPDGRGLAMTKANSNQAGRFDVETGECLGTIDGTSKIDCVHYSSDGNYLVTGERNSRLYVRDAKSRRELFSLKMDARNVYNVVLSHTNKYIAASTWGKGRMKVWDFATRQPVLEVGEWEGNPQGLAFSPDENLLAVVDDAGQLRVWNLATHTEIITTNVADAVLAVCFHPNGKQIVTADVDRAISYWNAQTGACDYTERGHEEIVTGLSFHPDGRRLASCSRDGIVRLWDASTHEEIFSLEAKLDGRLAPLTGLQFSPDGRRLAALVSHRGAIVWETAQSK